MVHTADILPRTRTKFGERGFHYSGPAAWNTLPSDLHDITDTNVFKKRLCLIVRTDLLLLLYGAPGRFVERRLSNLSLYLYLYLYGEYTTKLVLITVGQAVRVTKFYRPGCTIMCMQCVV